MSALPTTSAAPAHLDITVDDTPPEALLRLVRSELSSGETIEWFGQPLAQRFAANHVPAVLFGIPWTAFAVFWMVGASSGSALLGLFGIPFVLVGLGMLSAPFWALRDAHRTAYVITDRRAIVISSATGAYAGLSVRSLLPDRLDDIERRELPDGSGDIVFQRDTVTTTDGRRVADEAGFFSIPNVREVELRLRRLATRLSSRTSERLA